MSIREIGELTIPTSNRTQSLFSTIESSSSYSHLLLMSLLSFSPTLSISFNTIQNKIQNSVYVLANINKFFAKRLTNVLFLGNAKKIEREMESPIKQKIKIKRRHLSN